MGIDSGFDIYPRLESNAENQKKYQCFLNEIIDEFDSVYESDEDGKLLDLSGHSVSFKIGEWPSIPKNPEHCNYFLRFSSKVSGGCWPAERYIRRVYEIARRHFGSRVRFWTELVDDSDSPYNWLEIHAADTELQELQRKLEAEKEPITDSPTPKEPSKELE